MRRVILKRWLVLLWLCGALILAIHPVRAWMNGGMLLPYNGNEEAMYLIRTQEALLHPELLDVSNGVWSGSDAPAGAQSASMERIIGWLFFWTHWSAPLLVSILTVLIAPLILPFITLLARRAGASSLMAIACAVAYFTVIAFARREFHPGFSLPLTLGTLLALWSWWDHPRLGRALLAGALVGAGVGVYLWTWTYLFTVTGFLALFAVLWRRKSHMGTLPALLGAAVIVGLPAALQLAMNAADPHYLATSIRAGIVHSRMLESPIRSLMAVLLAVLLWRSVDRTDRSDLAPLLAMGFAIAVVFTQQIVHGVVISFVSHYEHVFLLSACVAAAVIITKRRWTLPNLGLLAIAALLCAASWMDHPARLHAFEAPSDRHQFLGSAVASINAYDGADIDGSILSDMHTADFIGMYTKFDTTFTQYTAFLLISDQEYRERFCLSELFAPPPLPVEDLVTYGEERLRVLRGQETRAQYADSIQTVRKTCDRVRKDPVPVLNRYNVTRLLWNERWRPDSKPDDTLFVLTKQGDGWSVWQRKETSTASSR